MSLRGKVMSGNPISIKILDDFRLCPYMMLFKLIEDKKSRIREYRFNNRPSVDTVGKYLSYLLGMYIQKGDINISEAYRKKYPNVEMYFNRIINNFDFDKYDLVNPFKEDIFKVENSIYFSYNPGLILEDERGYIKLYIIVSDNYDEEYIKLYIKNKIWRYFFSIYHLTNSCKKPTRTKTIWTIDRELTDNEYTPYKFKKENINKPELKKDVFEKYGAVENDNKFIKEFNLKFAIKYFEKLLDDYQYTVRSFLSKKIFKRNYSSFCYNCFYREKCLNSNKYKEFYNDKY